MDTVLPLFGAQLGIVHLAGGLFGVLGHILHRVGDFVDCRGHLFHLLRLLLAALLGLAGVVANIRGRLPQSMHCALQLADHALQLAGKAVEVGTQLGHFIAAVGIQAPGQVALATGDGGHGIDRLLQRPGNAAGDQHHQQSHHQGDTQAENRGVAQLADELGLHVVDVDARADHPAPRLEQLNVGGFFHRLAGTGLGPAVVDTAGALGLGQGGHLVEQGKAVRVANRRQVLAVELGVGRVHDHLRPKVIDPEVVILVVAQRPHHLQRLLLGGFAAECAGRLQPLVIGQYTGRGLHHVAGLFRLGLVQVTVDLAQHQQPQGYQHHHCHHQDQPQAPADRHTAKSFHGMLTPNSFYCCLHPSMLCPPNLLDQGLSA
ncbi:hypothetical protein D3C79_620620 [compost metagenome]